LEFDRCRYNGQMIPMDFVKKLEGFVEFFPICPEVEIGLGVPRDPIKLVERKGELKLVQPSTDRDLTAPMAKFASAYLKSLKDIDGFILKYGSPSCGINSTRIYPAKDNPIPVRKSSGMFAGKVLEKYSDLAVEDEGRLTNFRIREHFLTKIFLLARFRSVKKSRSFVQLVNFQTNNKLLLMAYSQKHMKALGKVIAVHKKSEIDVALCEYEPILHEAFMRNAKFTSHINVLMHALGYFKNDLNAGEKKHFLKMIERYRNSIVPLSAVISIMQSWIIKYDKTYLQSQAYFAPYPEELIEITDSGKGRDN
jgi:uncharacterized protein YbgA (DUF1722 family)/uncharacterized protein YbbK (DUF523 family)